MDMSVAEESVFGIVKQMKPSVNGWEAVVQEVVKPTDTGTVPTRRTVHIYGAKGQHAAREALASITEPVTIYYDGAGNYLRHDKPEPKQVAAEPAPT